MAGACSTYGERRGVYRVLVGKPEEKKPLERTELNGRIILRGIFRKWDGGMDWIDHTQDRDRWRTHVNTEMNLRTPKDAGIFLYN
jgi:hypothetical protein